MSGYAGLAARIQRALLDMDRVLPRIHVLIDRARRDDDFAVIDEMALNLQALSTGLAGPD